MMCRVLTPIHRRSLSLLRSLVDLGLMRAAIVSALICLLLLGSADSLADVAEADPFENLKIVAVNGRLTLYFDPENTYVIVYDAEADQTFGMPTLVPEGGRAIPFVVNQKRSLVEFTHAMRGDLNIRAGAEGDLGRGEREFTFFENGMSVKFTEERSNISVTVVFELGPDYLRVRVPEDAFVDTEQDVVVELALLPYFGAADIGEEGYFLIPDGSGSLAAFNPANVERWVRQTFWIYGRDNLEPKHQLLRLGIQGPTMLHPFFAMVRENGAIVAEITKGEHFAKLTIDPGDRRFQAYAAYFTRVYRREYLEYLNSFRLVRRMMDDRFSGDFEVTYHFLGADEADYSSIARKYRSLLQERGRLPETRVADGRVPNISLRFLMAVPSRVLGLPSVLPLSTADDVIQVIDDLEDRGLTNYDITLVGWGKGGMDGPWPVGSVESRIGGESGVRRIVDRASILGIRVVLEDNYLEVATDQTFRPLATFASRDLGSRLVRSSQSTQFGGRILTRMNPAIAVSRYMVSPVERWSRLGVGGMELRRVGDGLLNDTNRRQPLMRDEFADALLEMGDMVRDHMGFVAVEGALGLLVQGVDRLSGFPMDIGRIGFASADVPLYPMLIHGLVEYVGRPLNVSSDYINDLLRHHEYGAIPSFEVVVRNSEQLLKSRFNYLYSPLYSDWKEQIEEVYTERERLRHLFDLQMVSHRIISQDLREVVYENGDRVVVNYGYDVVAVEGVEVPSKGFVVIEGGADGQ